jgi:hypothetical protein
MTSVIVQTDLPNLLYRGKVRDTYALGSEMLLMVATDRISAFDVVLPTPIPEKGVVLAKLSAFWFRKTAHILPNHLLAMADEPEAQRLAPHNSGVFDLPDWAGVILGRDAPGDFRDVQLHVGVPGGAQHSDAPVPPAGRGWRVWGCAV